MAEPTLRLRQVTRVYNAGQTGEVRVLSGVDLDLEHGEVAGLVAPSGAGKSTLLHVAGLLDVPDSGMVAIAGQDASSASDNIRTRLRRDTIGFVYQFHHLLAEFSAAENIALPQRAAGRSRADAVSRSETLLAAVGLAERAHHRPAELSGGEQQRVAICRALANKPRLLLADEPTGNLDPGTSDQVFELLMTLVRDTGMAALIATHNLALAGRMDRVLRLSDGKIAEA